MSITYDTRHADARFSSEDTLYLTAIVQTEGGYRIQRLIPESVQNGILQFHYRIPPDGVFIDFELGPEEQVMNIERTSSAIFENGNPVAGGLPLMITNARSLDEARGYYTQDSLLYPERCERDVSMIMTLIRAGRSSSIPLEKLHALEAGAGSMEGAGSSPGTMLAAAALGYYVRGDSVAFRRVLSEMVLRGIGLVSSPGRGAVSYILNTIMGPDANPSIPDDVVCELASVIASIATSSRTQRLQACEMVLRMFDIGLNMGILKERTRECVQELLTGVVEIATRELLRSRGPEAVYSMQTLRIVCTHLSELGRYDAVIALHDSLAPAIAQSVRWVGDSPGDLLPYQPETGVEVQISYQHAKALLESGDSVAALVALGEIAHRKPQEYTLFQQSKALKDLARIARHRKDAALAYETALYTKAIRSVQSKEILSEIRGLVDPDTIKLPAELAELRETFEIPIRDIETARGTYSFGRQGDRLVMLYFSSDNCSVCRRNTPGLLDAALVKRDDVDVLHIHEGTHRDVTDAIRKNPHYYAVEASAKLNRAFKVRGYPQLYFVRDGGTLENGPTSPETLTRALSMLQNSAAGKTAD